jgi:hypothetical protein
LAGDNSYHDALAFMQLQFLSRVNDLQTRPVSVFVTCAVDTVTMPQIVKDIAAEIVRFHSTKPAATAP